MEDHQVAVTHVMKTDSENDTVSLNYNINSPPDIIYFKVNTFTFEKGKGFWGNVTLQIMKLFNL